MILRQQKAGFSLIELLIAVAVVGILATIAYPSYQHQVQQTRRAAATAVLLEAAQYMERFHTLNYRYDKTRDSTPAPVALPAHLQRSPGMGDAVYYNVSLSAVSASTYTLQAAPTGVQSGDGCGTLTLTNTGVRAASGSFPLDRCWR